MLINNEFIHVVSYDVEKPLATIVFMHGIAEHHMVHMDMIKYFNKNKINVLAFDLRGHGRSGGKRGDIDRLETFITDLEEIMKYARSKYHSKLFILGHSMGALIANLYAIDNKVDGVIVSGATGDFAKYTNILRVVPAKFIWFKKIKTNFQDPQLGEKVLTKEEVLDDPYLLDYFHINLIGQTMIKGVRKLKKGMSKITSPYLILHGEKDKLALPESNLVLYEGINSKDKTRIVYPELYHNVLSDYTSNKVHEKIVDWIKERT